jgi:hypothetical protein
MLHASYLPLPEGNIQEGTSVSFSENWSGGDPSLASVMKINK